MFSQISHLFPASSNYLRYVASRVGKSVSKRFSTSPLYAPFRLGLSGSEPNFEFDSEGRESHLSQTVTRAWEMVLEQADLAGGEVCAVGSRRARPYGMAS